MRLARTVWTGAALVTGAFASPPGANAQAPAGGPVEEIYVARSLREARDEPTSFCAPSRTGFGEARTEDRYSFWSVEVRGSDARVTDAKVQQVGDLRACFGSLGDGASFFYAEGSFGELTFTGRGDCRGSPGLSPEPGISLTRCYMDLSALPAEYVGGRLTTNTIGSRNGIGDVTDPPGYTQPSIATIRLWRRRS